MIAFSSISSNIRSRWGDTICGGEITNDKVKVLKDMSYSEFITLMPLLILVILLGVYPNIILDTISTSVENLVSVYNTKIATFNNLMIK